MIDVAQVRELIELMVEHGLGEIRIRQAESSITLRRGPTGEVMMYPQQMPMMPMGSMMPAAAPVAEPAKPAEDEGLVAIKSPMVGTFYAGPDPQSPPFITVGAEVTPDSPVCIIEAMKVFNEIKAEIAGLVERVLVKNEQAVEYGQPLMLVRPRS